MIVLYVLIWFFVFFGFMIATYGINGDNDYINSFNPLYIYEHTRCNWFGTIVITILWNMYMLPVAICYWTYKLFTVGRKD